MEASITFNHQQKCTSPDCGSDGDFPAGSSCPDCGSELVPLRGECTDCCIETESPDVRQCSECRAYDDAADQANDARDMEVPRE